MSTVNIAETSLPDGFLAGSGTVGTSEAKLSSVNFPVRKQLVIRADAANSNTIIVGRPGSAASGFILAAGEQTPPLFVDETDKVAIVGGAASQNYSWVLN